MTLDLVRSKLLEEWEKKNDKSNKEEHQPTNAFKVSKHYRSHISGRATSKYESEDYVPRCHFCDEEGHMKYDCKEFKKWRKWKSEKEVREKKNAETWKESKSEKVVKEEEYDAHTVFDGRKTYALSGAKEFNNGWVIDSGATAHICNDKAVFENIDYSIKEEIFTANGQKMTSIGRGTAKVSLLNRGIETVVSVQNAMYVPEAETNLLSVRSMSERGITVLFKRNYCTMMKRGKIIGVGKLVNGLYTLKEGRKVKNSKMMKFDEDFDSGGVLKFRNYQSRTHDVKVKRK